MKNEKYDRFQIKKVKDVADIRDFLPTIEIKGKTYCKCPRCNREGIKGMLVTHNSRMSLAKCFSCGHSINGAINAVMETVGSGFVEAVETVANHYGVPLEPKLQPAPEKIKTEKVSTADHRPLPGSFAFEQLAASGLTPDDVALTAVDKNGTTYKTSPFCTGAFDHYGNVNFDDDEMLIRYFDLHGKPMMYSRNGAHGGMRPYVRVRWSNPAAHPDGADKPTKYQTPKNAPTQIYIPERIRRAFQESEEIPVLFVQEGEKKAEKACKHGMMSVGIQGIFNIGNEQSGLIKEIQYIVKRCNVANLVLLFDSDWDQLSSHIEDGDAVDLRPNQFARAAIKFKRYVETMNGIGLSFDVWFGHVNGEDKGVDDLLNGALQGREETILDNIAEAMKDIHGESEFLTLYKISTTTEYKIFGYWDLLDADAFFSRHKEALSGITRCRFRKTSYTKDDTGRWIPSVNKDIRFWSIEKDTKGDERPVFSLKSALDFLTVNGYSRLRKKEDPRGVYTFIRREDGVVYETGEEELREFVYDTALVKCKDLRVIDLLTERLGSLMSSDRLQRLKRIEDTFHNRTPYRQEFYYTNGQVSITGTEIEFGQQLSMIWESQQIRRNFRRVRIIDDIERLPDGSFEIYVTEEGKKCEFLKYLMNTSDFSKDNRDHKSIETLNSEMNIHFVNKLTSIGYLLAEYKYPTEQKAIIAVDGKFNEVGRSEGRSGKSLVAVAIGKIISQFFIGGKNFDSSDKFCFTGLSAEHRNIFIDDIRMNFDFEALYPSITSDLEVNWKMGKRFTLKNEESPKFIITTNHAINDNSPSAQARMSYMVFSNHYTKDFSPADEFGHFFFSEWDSEQWTLFDNLMMECVMWYLRSHEQQWVGRGIGIVPPPMEKVVDRTLRQKIGDTFYEWASMYFTKDSGRLGRRLPRKEVFDDFSKEAGSKYPITPQRFRKNLEMFCQLSGIHLNIHKRHKESDLSFADWSPANSSDVFMGDRDISQGQEYFMLSGKEITG